MQRLERQQQPTAIEGEKGAFVVKVERREREGGGLLGKVGRGGGEFDKYDTDFELRISSLGKL